MMVGGPAFAALGALRAGCGLARLAMPESILAAGLSVAPSATGVGLAVDQEGELVPHLVATSVDALLEESRCVVVGPGLGTSAGAVAATLRLGAQDGVAVVFDADALNCLARTPSFHLDLRAPAIMTPHVGEFRRLGEAMGIEEDPGDARTRESAAAALAQKLGCIVVLKSSATVVSDGHTTWSHDEANPVLATAGSGDVLAGVVAGLVAQFWRAAPMPCPLSLLDCARLGVRAHALAARRWSERTGASGGLLALDLLEQIPAALELLR